MPYIGNQPADRFGSLAYQDLTGVTGSPVKRGFTLNQAVGNEMELEVFVNNVRQEPTVAYTVSGTTLTMTGDVETTDDFYVVFQGKAIGTVTHPSNTPIEATTGTFTTGTFSSGINTGTIKEATGTTTAMTVDSSGQVLMSAIPYARLDVSGEVSTALSSGAIGIVPYNNVLASRGITHNTSTYTFQVPVAGLYNFQGGLRWQKETSYLWWRVAQSDGTVVQNVLVISTGNSSGFVTCLGSILLPLAASTDYQIQFGDGSTSNSAGVYGGQSYMTIQLVGAS